MDTLLIILVLAAIAVGVVIWVKRRKPEAPAPVPDEADTAWDDRITPAQTDDDESRRP